MSVVGAAGFGLSLLLLLQSTELARCVPHATVAAGLARSQIIHWFGFAAATLAATFSAMPVATALAALMPFAAAPVVAAAGAVGALLALAATVIRPRRCYSPAVRSPPFAPVAPSARRADHAGGAGAAGLRNAQACSMVG